MLRELVQAAERFQSEGELLPPGYKIKSFKWRIDVDLDGRSELLGPFDRGDLSRATPDRQRSGVATERNLKPLLLADDARYALGISERGKQSLTATLHGGFLALVEQAARAIPEQATSPTDPTGLDSILRFLRSGIPADIRARIEPRDTVILSYLSTFPTDSRSVQAFWAIHLGGKTASSFSGMCGVCGNYGHLVQTLPQEVFILGQKCQITSFNKTAFSSFGREQTTNAPLCSSCAALSISALQYLLDPEHQHSRVLVRDARPGASPMLNQVAVFWLDEPVQIALDEEEVDLEQTLAGPLLPVATSAAVLEAEQLDRLDRMLRIPWVPKAHALRLDENTFHLAVLSANKARLVVREWLAAPVGSLRTNLTLFLDAVRLVRPDGGPPRPVAIPRLVRPAVAPETSAAQPASAAHDIRALLRTAYLGMAPAPHLLEVIVRLVRIPKWRKDEEAYHALMAVAKLVLTYGTKEARTMESLDRARVSTPYLCGRLLAVLEEAQRRSAWPTRLNTTLVDRFYGAVASAPAANLGYLIGQAQKAHFPKLRKDGKVGDLERQMEDILGGIDTVGGFEATLTMPQQAEFALGFYHQRAAMRGKPSTPSNIA